MDNLQNGIAAFRSRKTDEARKYFIAAMKENPNNENVWGWLYQVSKNDNEKIECLKRMLAINPNNARVREQLDQLQASPIQSAPPLQRPSQSIVEAPKKNNNWIWIAIASSFLIVCCLCLVVSLNTNPTTGIPSITGTQVKYVVTGSAQTAFITYFNAQGGTEQVDVNLPFTKEIRVTTGAALSLVAQNGGSGSLTCEIWVDGIKKKTSTSTAQYGVVTCSDWIY